MQVCRKPGGFRFTDHLAIRSKLVGAQDAAPRRLKLWLRCVLLDVPHALAVPIGNQRPVVPDKRLIAELGLAQVAGVEFEDENIALVAGNLKSEKGTF
jgi:hypothetical protein